MCQGTLRSAVRWSVGLVLAWSALVLPAAATTIVYRTDAELVALSDRIVRGRVVGVRAEPIPGGGVRTVTRIAVLEDPNGASEPIVEIAELGGALATGGMWVPGAARFVIGQHVLVCSRNGERHAADRRDGVLRVHRRWRRRRGRSLTRLPGDYALVGAPANGVAAAGRSTAFRRTVSAVKGVAATEPMSAAAVAALVGRRPRPPGPRPPGGRAVLPPRRRHPLAAKWTTASRSPGTATRTGRRPLTGADTDEQMQVAMTAWTAPPAASITLAFGGTRADSGPATSSTARRSTAASASSPSATRAISCRRGRLAIGGGCYSFETSVASGQTFNSFTNAYVIFNDSAAIAGYTTTPNFTRVLTHEIGHGIGLGHSDGRRRHHVSVVLQRQLAGAARCSAWTTRTASPSSIPEGRARLHLHRGADEPERRGRSSTGTLTVTASSSTCAWTATSGAVLGRPSRAGRRATAAGPSATASAANTSPTAADGGPDGGRPERDPHPGGGPCQFTVSPTTVAFRRGWRFRRDHRERVGGRMRLDRDQRRRLHHRHERRHRRGHRPGGLRGGPQHRRQPRARAR